MLAEHSDFLSFYQKNDVRVHFYGDFRREFEGTPYTSLSSLFDALTKKTANNKSHRLFYGVFGSDATAAIAGLSVQYYQKTGHIPTRRDLIELYYGEYIEEASLFIGFEKFTVFDYPMLGKGEESLYFTVAPSLYMDEHQLREILYDHIYLRPLEEPDYSTLTGEDIAMMHHYYQLNREMTFGVGRVRAGIWHSNTEVNG